jgi:hypothetical protein
MCRLQPAGTPCGAPRSCSGSTETVASACNGLGTCQPGGPRSCGAYLCSGDACGVSCSNTSQCVSGFYCIGTSCLPPRIANLTVNDTANASGWSVQNNFQVGSSGTASHPWSDYPNSYVTTIDSGANVLIGTEWVRVASASKNYTGGAQATITLSSVYDVYLLVDDRWGTSPSWTSGWSDTGLTLHVFESSSRPSLSFSLFKKAAQKGTVSLPQIGSNTNYDYFVIVN